MDTHPRHWQQLLCNINGFYEGVWSGLPHGLAVQTCTMWDLVVQSGRDPRLLIQQIHHCTRWRQQISPKAHFCRSATRISPRPLYSLLSSLMTYHVIPKPVTTELYADDALLHQLHPRCVELSLMLLQNAVEAAEKGALSWHGRFGCAKT